MELDAGLTDRRRHTRGSIYRHIYEAKSFCSRQSLARELGLSLPTVYQNLSELMSAGLVRDSGGQQATSYPTPGWRWGYPLPRITCSLWRPTCC